MAYKQLATEPPVAAWRTTEKDNSSTFGKTKLIDFLTSEVRNRPSTARSNRPSSLKKSNFDASVQRARKMPVSASRKMWCRINPGHTLQSWDTTARTTSSQEYHQDTYKFDKTYHVPKTEFLYVKRRKPPLSK